MRLQLTEKYVNYKVLFIFVDNIPEYIADLVIRNYIEEVTETSVSFTPPTVSAVCFTPPILTVPTFLLGFEDICDINSSSNTNGKVL